MPLKWTASAHTDVGTKKKINQDCYHCHKDDPFFILADGIGGRFGGEIASSITTASLASSLKTNVPSQNHIPHKIIYTLENSFHQAAQEVFHHTLERPTLSGMGTTATTLYLDNETAYITHVGDCRLYLIREGFLYLMTTDHKIINDSTDTDSLQEHLQMRSILSRFIGSSEKELVDNYQHHVYSGDMFFLCCDGLYEHISEEKMCQHIVNNKADSLTLMTDIAKENGSTDNITSLLVEVFEV